MLNKAKMTITILSSALLIGIILLLIFGNMAATNKTMKPSEPAHVHSYVENIVNATCQHEGYTERLCDCGYVYIGYDTKTEVIPHIYEAVETIAATCASDGYTTYKCTMCEMSYADDYTKKLAHDYKHEVVKPTTEAQGYTQHTCSVCKDSYRDSYVDKLPSPVYVDTDEYLYVATETLNVRTGPGTSYNIIKTLSKNTKVHRIAKGDNGWSKIEINNAIRFVSSNYLSKNKVGETIQEEMNRRGNIGRLTISSVGVDVALFKASLYYGGAQKTVDASDSAAYMEDAVRYYDFILIADHRHQGFDKIKKSVPGSTKATIDFGTHKETYICTEIFKGKNTGSDLVDMDGVSIKDRNTGGVCMYTCNTDGTITITFWQPV